MEETYQARVLRLSGSRTVADMATDIRMQFELAPPNGMRNHKIAPAKVRMREIEEYYRTNASHREETLAELKSRDAPYFEKIAWELILCLDAGAKI